MDFLRDSQARRREIGEAEVVARFQQRRRRCFWFGLGPMIVGITAPVLVGYAATGRAFGSYSWDEIGRFRVLGLDGLTLVFGGMFLFAAGLVFVLLTYRCPACGQLVGGAGGLPLAPDACAKCDARLAPVAAERAPARQRGTLGAFLQRVEVTVEGDRLVLVRNRLPRFLELALYAGFLTVWYWTLVSQLRASDSFQWILTLLFALVPVAVFARPLVDLLTVVLQGDTFVFYRATDRVVRNGQVICAMSRIGAVVLEAGQMASLWLTLQDGGRVRVDSSAWGDLPAVAKAIGDFVGVEVTTSRGRGLFRLSG